MTGIGSRTSLVALLLGCATTAAFASAPRVGLPAPRIAADTLTAQPAANVGKPLRLQRTIAATNAVPSAAFRAFTAAAGGAWEAMWDADTGVPLRIFGAGIAYPGSVATASIAEGAARAMLAAHLPLLAPGAAVTDFELVSNVSDGSLRSVGFFQRSGGARVVGGQVSFQFKHDRLFVIGSTALPNVVAPAPYVRMPAAALHDLAAASLRATLALPNAPVSAPGDEVVLPLVATGGVLGYRLVAPITIDGGAAGRYLAYADPTSGGIVALVQTNAYATGTIDYVSSDRYPGNGHVARGAVHAHVVVGDNPVTTDDDGNVTWDSGDIAVMTTIEGDYAAAVDSSAMPAPASQMFMLSDGGSVVWDETGVEFQDAQLNAFDDVNIAKAFIRENVDPDMPTLDDQIKANVNLDQTCNAFWDGTNVNFFERTPVGAMGTACENTALVQDVVFHEFGHHVHGNEIIMGVGAFDSAMSEGVADTLAVNITNDSGMGRGFFLATPTEPLRELDPTDNEWRWPEDIGEIHHTGLIIGGALWDLRKALIAAYGYDQGTALLHQYYLAALRSSVDIPSSLISILAYDDDDGDLSNGTPHECIIRTAYGRHGLRTVGGGTDAPGVFADAARAIGLTVSVAGLSSRCDSDAIASVSLSWRPPYTGIPSTGSAAMSAGELGNYFAELPLSQQETVSFRVDIAFADGSTFALPDNRADPSYQLYQGQTVPLYCTDFETRDPFAVDGWTTATADGSPSDWVWGSPTSGATDPPAAYSGTMAMVQALDGNYKPKQASWVKTPEIDIGQYSDVRLQYRRWLAVEDEHYDQAHITANDNQAWINATDSNNETFNHIDKEWRFHDVPLSGFFRGHSVTVGWDLAADSGAEFGGWALDDVCIVANPNAICGDGARTPTEECDDGSANGDLPDKCRTDCHLPMCGDGIVDSGEQCDAGSANSVTCDSKCKLVDVPVNNGCDATGTGGDAGAGAGLFAAAMVVARRRRRRRRST